MLGVEDASTSTPGWFQNRLPAIKRVFESLNAEEKAVLENEQEKMEGEGYPEKTKRRYVNPLPLLLPLPVPVPLTPSPAPDDVIDVLQSSREEPG